MWQYSETRCRVVCIHAAFISSQLAAAQCSVMAPVCVFGTGGCCLCGIVTKITRNCAHRFWSNWVYR